MQHGSCRSRWAKCRPGRKTQAARCGFLLAQESSSLQPSASLAAISLDIPGDSPLAVATTSSSLRCPPKIPKRTGISEKRPTLSHPLRSPRLGGTSGSVYVRVMFGSGPRDQTLAGKTSMSPKETTVKTTMILFFPSKLWERQCPKNQLYID